MLKRATDQDDRRTLTHAVVPKCGAILRLHSTYGGSPIEVPTPGPADAAARCHDAAQIPSEDAWPVSSPARQITGRSPAVSSPRSTSVAISAVTWRPAGTHLSKVNHRCEAAGDLPLANVRRKSTVACESRTGRGEI